MLEKFIFPSLVCWLMLLFGCQSTNNTEHQFTWPNHAKAAVCLTYDDGLDSHLDVVLPDLTEFNFKGTFYCTGSAPSLTSRLNEWQTLAAAGHEIGNHTLNHPCRKQRNLLTTYDWVKSEHDLAHFSMDQIITEIEAANQALKKIIPKTPATYAYTCNDYEVGKTSFVPEIKKRFSAARRSGDLPTSMKQLDIYMMPSYPAENDSGAALIVYLEKAKAHQTLATFMFHGVGGDYLSISHEAHRELLAYLNDNRAEFYVDTFEHITDHIRKEYRRLGWAFRE